MTDPVRRLSNADVAELLTFIRGNWGNEAASVSARDVAHVRAALDSQHPAKN